MVAKTGSDVQQWLKDGQLGLIVVHLLDTLGVALVALIIFALLYVYYSKRDQHLAKKSEPKPKLLPQVPPPSTVDQEVRPDVLATAPTYTNVNKIGSLKDSDTEATPKKANLKWRTRDPDEEESTVTTQTRKQRPEDKQKRVELKGFKPIDTDLKRVRPTEVKPKEVEPTEDKPKGVGPTEVKPKEVGPTEVKPKEVGPTEVKPKGDVPQIVVTNQSDPKADVR